MDTFQQGRFTWYYPAKELSFSSGRWLGYDLRYIPELRGMGLSGNLIFQLLLELCSRKERGHHEELKRVTLDLEIEFPKGPKYLYSRM